MSEKAKAMMDRLKNSSTTEGNGNFGVKVSTLTYIIKYCYLCFERISLISITGGTTIKITRARASINSRNSFKIDRFTYISNKIINSAPLIVA